MNRLKQIGQAVREGREEMNMTQQEVASATGLSRSYIADIESCRYTPSVESLTRLATFLHLDLSFLTNEEVTRNG